MTNKLVVIIKSLKVPKIKKILLYEMKFLVPIYSCLQTPRLGGYRPQTPVLSVLNEFVEPPPKKKFLGTPLVDSRIAWHPYEYLDVWIIMLYLRVTEFIMFIINSQTL